MSARVLLTEVAETTRKALAGEAPGQGLAPGPRGRAALSSLDAFGLLVPEDRGGIGADLVAMVGVLEEVGRAAVGRFFMASAVLSAVVLVRSCNDEQKERYLPSLASGSELYSLAFPEAGGTYAAAHVGLVARPDAGGVRLNGEKHFVPGLMSADRLIVVARDPGGEDAGEILLAVVDAPEKLQRVASGGSRPGDGSIVFDDVPVSSDSVLSCGDTSAMVTDLVSYGAIAESASMVGGAERVLELSVAYALARKQFGTPIGSRPAVQRRCAEMRTDIDAARALTHRAAVAVGSGEPDGNRLASMAKAWTSRACRRVMASAHLVHGAIGFSDEYGLHDYTRAQMESWSLWGDPRFHAAALADSF